MWIKLKWFRCGFVMVSWWFRYGCALGFNATLKPCARGCGVNVPSKSNRIPLRWVMLRTSQHGTKSRPTNETKARRTPAGACPKLQKYMHRYVVPWTSRRPCCPQAGNTCKKQRRIAARWMQSCCTQGC